jgi:hypothetical protein
VYEAYASWQLQYSYSTVLIVRSYSYSCKFVKFELERPFCIFCIPVCSCLLTITHNRHLTFCLRSLSVVTVMMCLLALSVHCSVISLSIGKSIGIGDTIIRKYRYRRYFLNEYRYRTFAKYR